MRLVKVIFIVLLLAFPAVGAYPVPERGVVYQVMVDRFYDGNQSNNGPFYDPEHRNYRLYWGGDLEGLTENLDYIASLGVSMIWVSPLNDNINKMAHGSAPYHGYWTRDYKRIEEHFGTWKDFLKLVEEAKKRGICIIVDYVPNHSNPAMDGEFGSLYDNGTKITDYFEDTKNASVNPITGIREEVYHHNGNIFIWSGIQLKYANLYGLADFNQLNPWVDSYLTEGARLFIENGACGLRIDAVKHMELGWLESFYLRLYSERPLFIYGEYYTPSPGKSDDLYEFYRYSNVSPVLNIPIRADIVKTFGFVGSLETLSAQLGDYYSRFLYPNKQLNFLDSHDLIRFLNGARREDAVERFHMALALTMTLPGIPVIYYGDESYLVSRDGKGDPYNRPMMVFNNTTEAARIIRTLAKLRKTNDALAFGDFRTVYANYSVWAFERTFGAHRLLVVMNKGSPAELSINLDWPDGTYADVLYGAEMVVENGKATVELPRNSFYVFHIEREQEGPLIGSLTPYTARPGQEILIAGAGFGSGGRVTIGGVEARVLSWNSTEILVEVPSTKTGKAWLDVVVETGGKVSNVAKLRYYSGNGVPALIALNASLVNLSRANLWIKGNLSELAEPRPLLKSSTGYYFTVAPLPKGASFSVELYEGPYWGELRPLGVKLYGFVNSTVVVLREEPHATETAPAMPTTTVVQGPIGENPLPYLLAALLLLGAALIIWKKRG
ncbi:alpha-amylase family glycosyl hydrolase [Thermococcus thioreducens]|uniref:Alpha-amylase n=1 Tax=Thermococcus thioreducens TaxID=277988 RepID=A0A0Q2XPV0_9EURY|nr:alpha-amylase family glycosyl hydrolase [Thermococcus thioreducens]ASJ13269.1 alpha-amylase [Thermococcus thioreducens]KQH83316.1 alpha-amylase [Thermococcus thioreducens]SEW21835.1 cyclomaltodextrin glucanotransferase [Thermococcus thioreducens]